MNYGINWVKRVTCMDLDIILMIALVQGMALKMVQVLKWSETKCNLTALNLYLRMVFITVSKAKGRVYSS